MTVSKENTSGNEVNVFVKKSELHSCQQESNMIA